MEENIKDIVAGIKRANIRPACVHPNSKDTIIKEPHEKNYSSCEEITDRFRRITFVPGYDKISMSTVLNNIALYPWIPEIDDWNDVYGQAYFNEPELINDQHFQVASGVIIKEKDGRIWTVSPTNQFGGYYETIGPKGKVDPGLNMRANAIKEAWEETGLQVALTGHAADVVRTTSITRYYWGVRIGGHPGNMGWETQAVHLTRIDTLEQYMNTELDKELVRKLFNK